MGVSNSHVHTNRWSPVSFLFLLVVIGILGSCRHTGKQSAPLVYTDGTPAFNKVIDRAAAINDAGYTQRALYYLDSFYHYASPAGMGVIDTFHYYYFHFDIYNRSKHHALALLYADSMQLSLENSPYKSKYMKQYIEAVFSKGDALFAAGNYNAAYKDFYSAKMLAKDNFDSCSLNHYNYRLGMVLYKQERYDDAVNYFKQSVAELQYCDFSFSSFYRTQENLDNIGLCYYHIGMNDSALLYFNKAINYVKDKFPLFPDKNVKLYNTALAVIYGNMASVYKDEKKYDEAEELLKRSITINGQPGYDNTDAQLTRLKLANLYYLKGQPVAMLTELQIVKQALDTVPNINVQLGWNNAVSQYYNYTSQPQLAYNYLLSYKNLKDSLDKATKFLKETDWNERVKNQDKQYQINILEKNNQIKQYYLIIVAVIAIASIVILLLILQNYRKSSRSVTQLLALNDQINQQNIKLAQVLKELELADKEKDRILRAVAHDVRNPIAAISALANLLLDEKDHFNEEQKEMIELMLNASTDALSLTGDILHAADAGAYENMPREQVDIRSLLTYGIELLKFRAAEKKQHIILRTPDDLPSMQLNREKIWRAISNIITNAIKFSPEGADIYVSVTKNINSITIAVRDNGIGIPAEIKDKIFDMFTEAKRAGTAGEKPFGLGLSISKQIIEGHGGSITFSDNDNGTTFYIMLPVTQ